jgi:hypothetical protein
MAVSGGSEMPFALVKRLASGGPVSLLDSDDIDCACVLAIAGLVHAEYPEISASKRQVDDSPITVLGLTPRGVRFALSRSAPAQRSARALS